MREQLDYLIQEAALHEAAMPLLCACPACRRYRLVRSVLLDIFREPKGKI